MGSRSVCVPRRMPGSSTRRKACVVACLAGDAAGRDHRGGRGTRGIGGRARACGALAGCAAPAARRAPRPTLALQGELDLRGKSKLRTVAYSPLAIIAVVLIVLIIVAGKVLIAWPDGAQREDSRRPASGRCTERIERTCERGGSRPGPARAWAHRSRARAQGRARQRRPDRRGPRAVLLLDQ